MVWQSIAEQIRSYTGENFHPTAPHSIGGGCINQAFKLSDGQQTWFVKSNSLNYLSMFDAEAAGLNALADTQTIRVPRALCTGTAENQSYIVMEYVASGRQHAQSQAFAGEQLAAMHQHQQNQFGWSRDNTIGTTTQRNKWRDDWLSFWRDQRLGFQLTLAAQNGYAGRLQTTGEQLMVRFHVLIDHAPTASILHGDLWGGNRLFDQNGDPVIFDPAVYFGDREADLAMTELFGGFSADFYAAYNAVWSLDAGYSVRKTLYNLYHILNHLNLFGSGYASQAQSMIDRLLAEC